MGVTSSSLVKMNSTVSDEEHKASGAVHHLSSVLVSALAYDAECRPSARDTPKRLEEARKALVQETNEEDDEPVERTLGFQAKSKKSV